MRVGYYLEWNTWGPLWFWKHSVAWSGCWWHGCFQFVKMHSVGHLCTMDGWFNKAFFKSQSFVFLKCVMSDGKWEGYYMLIQKVLMFLSELNDPMHCVYNCFRSWSNVFQQVVCHLRILSKCILVWEWMDRL